MKTDKSTIIRMIVLGITLLNQVLVAFGVNPLPFSNEVLYEIVSIIITIGVSLYTAWKNNSWTIAAKIGDKIMHAIKNGSLTAEKVEDFLTFNENNNQ